MRNSHEKAKDIFKHLLFWSITLLVITSGISCKHKPPKKPSAPVEAAFSTTSIITGYTIPAASSTITSETVTLTIQPNNKAATVALVIGGVSRGRIQNIVRNAAAGTVQFDVKGSSATPTNQPNGDTKVLAQDAGKTIAEANVIVVIPSAVGTPHDEPKGAVTPFNQAGDATTSPAFWGLPPGQVKLLTWYVHNLTIRVNDQFGHRLNRIYAGTGVTEHGLRPINQNMTATGTYSDPVGVYRYPANSIVPRMVPDPNHPGQQIQNPVVTNFLNGPVQPIYLMNETQNIRVEVGGHSLNPAIVNRRVISRAPNIIDVTWP